MQSNSNINEKLRPISVEYDDGTIINTSINGTDEEIRDYFKIGRLINIGTYPTENVQPVKSVNILDDEDDTINEDGDGSGVAIANAGTTSGMGNVAASQPSSTPGAAFTGDGTTGSGDIGMPLGVYTKKGAMGQKYIKHTKSNKKKKSKKLMSDVADFLKTHKKGGGSREYGNTSNNSGKTVMNYQNFIKDKSTKVNKIDK